MHTVDDPSATATSQWKIPSVSELSVKMAINQAVIISSEDLSSGRRLVCLEKHVVRSCGSLDRGG